MPRRPGPTTRLSVTEHSTRRDAPRSREDRIITEEPLEIRLRWPGEDATRVWTTMRTPGHDFELAAGWALHEGWLPREGLDTVAYCTDAALPREQEFNVVTVSLAAAPPRLPSPLPHHHSSGSSACGVCGQSKIEQVLEVPRGPRWAGPQPTEDVVRSLPGRLRTRQRLFDRTGGVHAAGLFTADGTAVVVREDVGRHNAVDKVAGARLLAADPVGQAVLVVSGRAGFELVQKAVAQGTGALVAVGAPTSLAVDLARRSGLTLYGFTGDDRTVRYA
ncbi:sulfurtransferase FdhD [Nocardioides jishulii]|uniref:Sulfurtransferase FdhD n=1 Tax=Nocardioides jishulii TaxID=2575440 RepID=A0A4U2YPK2_9ACTN|nr:sulfurtransferase FdhD [Nocardioides jishulii]TKI62784.1 sulfurtransferase FdhD [Nocardioides jishulii]